MVASTAMHTEAGRNLLDVDEHFMQLALCAAQQASTEGEVPIGAVVVRGERIIGSAYNAPIASHDPTGHAEILALRAAALNEANYRLPAATIYVTVEPCLMCVGAMLHARLWRVVFGCREPKLGALGSVYDAVADYPGNHRLQVTGGVCADAASAILRQFFRARRGA
jgi:tRNA(adenine34) deaminase